MAAVIVQWITAGLLTLVSLLVTAMPSAPATSAACESMTVDGYVIGLASSIRYEADSPVAAPMLSISLDVGGDVVFVDLAPDATVSADDGSIHSANQLLPGQLVRVYGVWQSSEHVLATHIDATPSAPAAEAGCAPGGSA